MDNEKRKVRLCIVVASRNSGGIGPVCQYAAEAIARISDWEVTLVCLHDVAGDGAGKEKGVRVARLGLTKDCARLFLLWLRSNPQDVLVTNDVSTIELSFPYIPSETTHVIHIHDSAKRYIDVARRNAAWIQGIICVARHMEPLVRKHLKDVAFSGMIATIYNGACFPRLVTGRSQIGPLRLLFIGRVEPLKGVFDFVPLLDRLRKRGVPVTLNIVGGEHVPLRRILKRKRLDQMVIWSGRLPHAKCYDVAAASHILIMPSRKEAFGMVTIEAMSMGCVPIAYDIPSGSREIIEDGKSGFLVGIGDISAMASVIEKLHCDRNLLGQMSWRAVERARNFFSAERMGENMVRYLNALLAHGLHRRAQRLVGAPSTPMEGSRPKFGYHRLPGRLRSWIRDFVGRHARLCYWLYR